MKCISLASLRSFFFLIVVVNFLEGTFSVSYFQFNCTNLFVFFLCSLFCTILFCSILSVLFCLFCRRVHHTQWIWCTKATGPSHTLNKPQVLLSSSFLPSSFTAELWIWVTLPTITTRNTSWHSLHTLFFSSFLLPFHLFSIFHSFLSFCLFLSLPTHTTCLVIF